MKREYESVVSYVGMFDLLKGIGMLMVVFGHTINNYAIEGNNIGMLVFGVGYILVAIGVLQAFFLMSGYGFRKTSIRECVKRQTRMMLRPYVYILIATAVLHIITRYFLTHSIKAALLQTWPVVGGFLLALSQNMEIGGTLYYFCGAMWYIIALLVGWIILNTLMNVVEKRYMPLVVWGCALIGWLIGKDRVIPFCIGQGLIAVLYLYYGYQLKKKKILAKPMTKTQIVIAIFICVASLGLVVVAGKTDNMADGIWLAGLISIGMDGYIGYLLLRLGLKLNSFKGRFWELLKKIGSNSLYIFTVHTVEMHGIPWWYLIDYMADRPVLGCLLHFVLRCAFILIGVIIYKKVMRRIRRCRAIRRDLV